MHISICQYIVDCKPEKQNMQKVYHITLHLIRFIPCLMVYTLYDSLLCTIKPAMFVFVRLAISNLSPLSPHPWHQKNRFGIIASPTEVSMVRYKRTEEPNEAEI